MGLKHQGGAQGHGVNWCMYGGCGAVIEQRFKVREDELLPSERWQGDRLTGECVTFRCWNAKNYTARLNCNCASVVLFLDPITGKEVKPPYILPNSNSWSPVG